METNDPLTPPGYFSHLELACAKASSNGQIEIIRSAIESHEITTDEFVDDDDLDKAVQVAPVFKQTYTIAVPVKVNNESNDDEVCLQLETRMRTISLDEGKVFKPVPNHVISVSAEALEFFRLNHSEISKSDAIVALGTRSPVVLIRKNEPLDAFYQAILAPETVVILDSTGVIPVLISTQAE